MSQLVKVGDNYYFINLAEVRNIVIEFISGVKQNDVKYKYGYDFQPQYKVNIYDRQGKIIADFYCSDEEYAKEIIQELFDLQLPPTILEELNELKAQVQELKEMIMCLPAIGPEYVKATSEAYQELHKKTDQLGTDS